MDKRAKKAATELINETRGGLPIFPPGDQIGDFRIERILGEGNFAIVYLAKQLSLDRQVALKISTPEGDEARVLAKLEHDHIVTVFSETRLKNPDLKIVCMQFIPGLTLDRIIELPETNAAEETFGRRALHLIDESIGVIMLDNPAALRFRDVMSGFDRLDLALWVGASLSDALSHAHTHGILHLDVKPTNILFSVYGRPLLTDFNVSVDSRTIETNTEQLGGTFFYMAPEQKALFDRTPADLAAGVKNIDARADVFSLGKVVEELLPRDLSVDPILADKIAWVMKRCLAPDPRERFSSAKELRNAFTHLLELRTVCRGTASEGPLTKWISRWPLTAITLLGSLPQVVGCLVAILYNDTRIVMHLSPRQKTLFDSLNQIYDPAMFGAIGLIWMEQLRRVHRAIRISEFGRASALQMERARKLTLRLPIWGLVTSVMGWLPSALVYPITLDVFSEGLVPTIMFHFFTAFVLCWSIATAYTFLLHEYWVLRVLYPRLWSGDANIASTAPKELRTLKAFRQIGKLAIVAPLLGVLLLLFSEEGHSELANFRTLAILLVGAGLFGAMFAFRIREKIDQLIFRYRKR